MDANDLIRARNKKRGKDDLPEGLSDVDSDDDGAESRNGYASKNMLNAELASGKEIPIDN